MFTVIVCFDWSGKSKTRNPLGKRYSVMPSTDVTRVTPRGKAGAFCPRAGALNEAMANALSNSPDRPARTFRKFMFPPSAKMNVELTVEAVRASDGLTTIPYPFELRQLVSGIVPADGHRR